MARAVLDGLDVPADAVVLADPGHYVTIAAALFAAEASVWSAWCQRTGLAYIKVREQFGRTIGSFQAIKHKCAPAVRPQPSSSQRPPGTPRRPTADDPEQFAAAAAAAVQRAARRGRSGLDTVTLLGGIGYTWEHDIHLYWRRAMTLLSLLGPAAAWEHRLGRAGPAPPTPHTTWSWTTSRRSASLGRRDLREAAAMAPDTAAAAPADRGLVAPHYPRPYGLRPRPRPRS